jgi:hypothetical protein
MDQQNKKEPEVETIANKRIMDILLKIVQEHGSRTLASENDDERI